jgi:hypothetical protein
MWVIVQLAEARSSGKARLLFPSQAQITSMQWPQALLLFGYMPPNAKSVNHNDLSLNI